MCKTRNLGGGVKNPEVHLQGATLILKSDLKIRWLGMVNKRLPVTERAARRLDEKEPSAAEYIEPQDDQRTRNQKKRTRA